jgi:hypothetical protein
MTSLVEGDAIRANLAAHVSVEPGRSGLRRRAGLL